MDSFVYYYGVRVCVCMKDFDSPAASEKVWKRAEFYSATRTSHRVKEYK